MVSKRHRRRLIANVQKRRIMFQNEIRTASAAEGHDSAVLMAVDDPQVRQQVHPDQSSMLVSESDGAVIVPEIAVMGAVSESGQNDDGRFCEWDSDNEWQDFGVDSDGSIEEEDCVDTEVGDGNDEIRKNIRQWVLSTNQTVAATNSLLKILSGKLNIPKTYKTLMRTPLEKVIVRNVSPGSYAHFGIRKYFAHLDDPDINERPEIVIDIGIDGGSLSNSSSVEIWPIMGILVNSNHDAFVIGSYSGSGKPKSPCELCLDFCNEVEELFRNGVAVGPNKILKPFKINALICDAPARAFITGVRCHGHKHACSKCTAKREKGSKVNYPTTVGRLRTDVSFSNRRDPFHHQKQYRARGSLVLEKLDLGLVSAVPLEIMHLLDLGMGKSILKAVVNGRLKGGPNDIEAFKSKYLSYFEWCPNEFSRKPRSLKELPRFKATECRQFLLYIGLVLMKDCVEDSTYEHFLLLVCAYRILAVDVTDWNAEQAEMLLQEFVSKFKYFYNKDSIRFNVHCLLHLAACGKQFGNLSRVTAYRFENQIGKLKRLLKSNTFILQKINNRITEQYSAGYFPKRKFNFNIMRANQRDSCFVQQSGKIVVIVAIDKDEATVREFDWAGNFFEKPLLSSDLGIFLVRYLLEQTNKIPLKTLGHKCYRIPYQNSFVVIPILITNLHTCNNIDDNSNNASS